MAPAIVRAIFDATGGAAMGVALHAGAGVAGDKMTIRESIMVS